MEITLNTVISQSTSYGLTGIQLTEALSALGHKINCVPIGGRADFPREYDGVARSIENGLKPFDKLAPSVRLYHQFSLLENCGRGPSIGFPIFELDNFTPQEFTNLSMVDRLFTCSKWAKEVIKSVNISTPVEVVPLGVDREVFNEVGRTETDKPFTFFFPGKFEIRKGFDIVVEVFEKAFNVNDNFEVIFLPQNLFISQKDTEEWVRYLSQTKFGNKFKILGRIESSKDVANLNRYADYVVSLSRAEGFNLPLLEAMSCGTPVIATNYSAHTEYCTADNATLIDCSGRESAYDNIFFHGTGSWLSYSNSDIDNMVEAIRMAYRNGPKVNLAGIETAKQFTWNNSALKLIEGLSGL